MTRNFLFYFIRQSCILNIKQLIYGFSTLGESSPGQLGWQSITSIQANLAQFKLI